MTSPGGSLGITVTSLAERGDLEGFLSLRDSWPVHMTQDPTGQQYYDRIERFAEFCLLARDEDDQVIARLDARRLRSPRSSRRRVGRRDPIGSRSRPGR